MSAFTEAQQRSLAEWRGYSPEFCAWLRTQNFIGLYDGNWALPVHGEAGAVVGIHYRLPDGSWRYEPKGLSIRSLVLGNAGKASTLMLFESPWDAFAVLDRLDRHKEPQGQDRAVVVTRGAGNGRLVAGLFSREAAVYAFKQNDETKNGKNAANEWLADIRAHAGGKVFCVSTPAAYKDLNDWTRAGATPSQIMAAIQDAKLVHERPLFSGDCRVVENVESVESGSPTMLGQEPFSTFSTGGLSLDRAVYPEGSWLARYMDFARLREESADCYLIGSILPVVGATLARRIRFPWSEGSIYPNLFVMLAGKPGDRKSSAINLAEKVARLVLDSRKFLPESLSVEALVDEYDNEHGGSPDKLLIADDANPFLGLIQKSNYGERVGEQLLKLFDCKGLAESFRRNKADENSTSLRYIPETSTSIVMGATFNICQFHGHAIRSGLQRRFNYYVADGHGRFLVVPVKSNVAQLSAVTDRLGKLVSLSEMEYCFAPEAAELWEKFQRENRRQLASTNINQESQLARLNGQPTHVMKLAMIFQAALWAETSQAFTGVIEPTTLLTAIEHSNHCVVSAQALDSIGNRAAIQADADVLLARIRTDFPHKSHNSEIVLTRTDLTSTYAHHSKRRGTLGPDDLYLRLIPDLIRRRKAREVSRASKQSAFAFKLEEDV